MSERPEVPPAIRRALKFESGDLCAVCGTSYPLQFAHIEPYHVVKEHREENMICLCANCHGKADLGKLDKATLKEFKRRPWVLRHKEYAEGAAAPTTRVHVRFEMEKKGFDEEYENLLRFALAGLLGVPPSRIQIRLSEDDGTGASEDHN